VVGEHACRHVVADDGPIDQHILFIGPLDERHGDTAMLPGLHRSQDPHIQHRGGIAIALQGKTAIIDAARHIGREHEQQVDFFLRLGGRCRRTQDDDADQQGTCNCEDHDVPPGRQTRYRIGLPPRR
jgi:hypothetical protein